MAVFWAFGLTMMSLVLLWTHEPGSFQYWARVGCVAIAWCIFLLLFTPLRSFKNLKVISSSLDDAIIVLILVLFFVITSVAVVNALAHLNPVTAVLFGLVWLGLFNILRDITAKLLDKPRSVNKTDQMKTPDSDSTVRKEISE